MQSNLYGSCGLKPRDEKIIELVSQGLKNEEIAREIGSLDVSFEVNAVHLVNASASLPVTKWRDLARHDVGRK